MIDWGKVKTSSSYPVSKTEQSPTDLWLPDWRWLFRLTLLLRRCTSFTGRTNCTTYASGFDLRWKSGRKDRTSYADQAWLEICLRLCRVWMKSAIILNNFEILQNDPETGAIFSQPPLISFKRDKNEGSFLVKSTFKTIEKPGTFKCVRSRWKTCPFVQNADKISSPKRSVKITDRFTCTSANGIYCITCTLCKKLYIGETGRRLGDRSREHLCDVEKDDKDASKPVTRNFNLPNHSVEGKSPF